MLFILYIRKECYCGQSYGKYVVVDACKLECPKSSTELCGGKNANSIWRITTTIRQ